MSEETIPQMREQIDSLKSDLKSAKEGESSASSEVRDLTGQVIALGQGFSKAQGGLYAKVTDGELSAESFDAFATEQGLPASKDLTGDEGDGDASADEGDPASSDDAGSADLAGMSRGTSRPGDSAGGASKELMTRAEWQDLHRTDPVAAKEAVRQGKVEISRDNPWGDGQPVAPGKNPYVPSVSSD